jgi:hypothetical protein
MAKAKESAVVNGSWKYWLIGAFLLLLVVLLFVKPGVLMSPEDDESAGEVDASVKCDNVVIYSLWHEFSGGKLPCDAAREEVRPKKNEAPHCAKGCKMIHYAFGFQYFPGFPKSMDDATICRAIGTKMCVPKNYETESLDAEITDAVKGELEEDLE